MCTRLIEKEDKNMILKKIKVQTTQDLFTNSYIICDESTKEAMVIDPGGEPEKIAEVLDMLRM